MCLGAQLLGGSIHFGAAISRIDEYLGVGFFKSIRGGANWTLLGNYMFGQPHHRRSKVLADDVIRSSDRRRAVSRLQGWLAEPGMG